MALQDGQTLRYNSTLSVWETTKLNSGDINGGTGATDLNGLSDVTLSAPAAAHILVHSGGPSEWINFRAPFLNIPAAHVAFATTPSDGSFTGTAFVTVPDSTAGMNFSIQNQEGFTIPASGTSAVATLESGLLGTLVVGTCVVGLTPASGVHEYEVGLFVNGAIQPETVVGSTCIGSQTTLLTLPFLVSIAGSDTLDVRVRCVDDGTVSATVERFSLVLRALGRNE